MTLDEVYAHLNGISPFELQEKWDNSGLIVGDLNEKVRAIVLSIDIDEALLESIDEDTLVIVHHPLIFNGLKALDFSAYPSKLLQIMVKKNIACIAMHTNFDKTHLNQYVAEEVLGFKCSEREDFVIYMDVDMSYEALASHVKKVFNLDYIKAVKTSLHVKRLALTTGSGASLIPQIKADYFLTGDIKYHDAMDAKTRNLGMIDIGHYESERFFAQILAQELENLDLEVIISSSKNPFTYN